MSHDTTGFSGSAGACATRSATANPKSVTSFNVCVLSQPDNKFKSTTPHLNLRRFIMINFRSTTFVGLACCLTLLCSAGVSLAKPKGNGAGTQCGCVCDAPYPGLVSLTPMNINSQGYACTVFNGRDCFVYNSVTGGTTAGKLSGCDLGAFPTISWGLLGLTINHNGGTLMRR